MWTILTEIEIDAPAADVWRTLLDFSAYPEWNSFIPWVRGTARVGETLEVRIEAPGGRGSRGYWSALQAGCLGNKRATASSS